MPSPQPVASTAPGVQPPPAQVPQGFHWQLALQVRLWVPNEQLPHAWDSAAPGTQTPWLVHGAGADQVQSFWHVDTCAPQLPHGVLVVVPGAHTPWPLQLPGGPHVQSGRHVIA
jgi:hypothetical protein